MELLNYYHFLCVQVHLTACRQQKGILALKWSYLLIYYYKGVVKDTHFQFLKKLYKSVFFLFRRTIKLRTSTKSCPLFQKALNNISNIYLQDVFKIEKKSISEAFNKSVAFKLSVKIVLELFWSAFSRIRTKYREILRISPYSVQMRENVDQNNSEYRNFLRSDCTLVA